MSKTVKTTKLTEKQKQALAIAFVAERNAIAASQEASQRRSDVVALILDAHGAPEDGSINIETGIVTHAAPVAAKADKGTKPTSPTE